MSYGLRVTASAGFSQALTLKYKIFCGETPMYNKHFSKRNFIKKGLKNTK